MPQAVKNKRRQSWHCLFPQHHRGCRQKQAAGIEDSGCEQVPQNSKPDPAQGTAMAHHLCSNVCHQYHLAFAAAIEVMQYFIKNNVLANCKHSLHS